MPFPLPSIDDLVRQQEAFMEFSLRRFAEAKGLNVSPEAIARAVRSPVGMVSAIVRGQAQSLYTCHQHLRWWGDQYMPDTAEIEQLIRHSGIWGIFRRPATKAIGKVVFEGSPGTAIPVDLELRSASGVLYRTTTLGAIPAGGSATVNISASDAGVAGNLAGGSILTLVSPLVGLSQQRGIVDAEGLAGGAEEEDLNSLLDRLLKRIREPAHGGAFFDYPNWIFNAFAASHVRTLPNWVGKGTVGVCIAMGTKAEPRVPTSTELDAMLDYLGRVNSQTQGVRPVTAEVVMVPAELLPVPMQVRLTPDEIAIRNAVTSAQKAFFARDAAIGEKLYLSRLSEAISAAQGEYAHDLLDPVANVVPTPRQLPVPGSVTWAGPLP
ncbi:baseplate J/gp47 family protein [Microvirga terricola]|uniref:Baseplate J/gp47 family protein n=1 Tax=Microvirga terricola TaxID=2719797 RepID=A0ABX0V856_9HYPH|nr:baseplate J/gp47 family protein [Microvirga terricola]NIX75379.1 baseplate J/gp47 family protein [Microvirga terricola]